MHSVTEVESNPMAELTEDLIVEILSRLPVKPLLRFKCVSRGWCSLISGPRFAKIQLQRATEGNNTSSQRIITGKSVQTIDYEALDDGVDGSTVVQLHNLERYPNDWIGLFGHCHGLVCLQNGGEHVLYNPTTRQSRIITRDNKYYRNYPIFYGFGYDPATDDYKILEGEYVNSADGFVKTAIKIFALGPDSWRTIPNSHVAGLKRMGIYLNGALHWLVVHRTGWTSARSVVSFDLAEEKFKEVLQLPDRDTREGGLDRLGVHGTRLLYYGTWRDGFKGWIMNEFGKKESWVGLFDVPTYVTVQWPLHMPVTVCYTKNQKIVLAIFRKEMFLFDQEDKTSKPIPLKGRFYESMVYVESLVSPYVGSCGHRG